MTSNTTLCVCIIIIFIIIFVLTTWNSPQKDNFAQVLGALGPYKHELAECISECEKQDPNRRLQANGNIGCDKRCYSILSQKARSEDPQERVVSLSDINPIGDGGDNITENIECEELCSSVPATHASYRKCISMCKCQKEVQSWCSRLWCPYSDSKNCMNDCMKTNLSKCNQVSWTWKQF
ncbi:hypothetical protein OAG24_01260 [bacterium]|nr:hypothetical protein [bacterium]